MPSQRRQSLRPALGLSLVEVLVALVLGVFLIGGIIQVMASSRSTYRFAEAKARAQENGRYALQVLARELRPTRNTGCRSVADGEFAALPTFTVKACALLTNCNGTGTAQIGSKARLGFSPTSAANWPTPIAAAASHWLRGDVLITWGATGQGFYVAPNTTQGTNPDTIETARKSDITLAPNTYTEAQLKESGLAVQSPSGNDTVYKQGRLALITDCEGTDVFAISNAPEDGYQSIKHEAGANQDDGFAHSYNLSGTTVRARVFPFDLDVYFICCVSASSGFLQEDDGVDECRLASPGYRPALCRWSMAEAETQSLVLDVADMRVTYEGRLDSQSASPSRLGDLYSASRSTYQLPSATWVQTNNHWDKVSSARIELLVTGGDEVRQTAQQPELAAPDSTSGLGENMPDDRRLYETFDATIAIRSRLP